MTVVQQLDQIFYSVNTFELIKSINFSEYIKAIADLEYLDHDTL